MSWLIDAVVGWVRRAWAFQPWGDEEQIKANAASAGVDLSRPVVVTHHLYFLAESRAAAATDALRREGFSVELAFCPDDDPPEWELVAKRKELVTLDQMRSLRAMMERLTQPDDEYDGSTIFPDAQAS